jgi:hypothetical protein
MTRWTPGFHGALGLARRHRSRMGRARCTARLRRGLASTVLEGAEWRHRRRDRRHETSWSSAPAVTLRSTAHRPAVQRAAKRRPCVVSRSACAPIGRLAAVSPMRSRLALRYRNEPYRSWGGIIPREAQMSMQCKCGGDLVRTHRRWWERVLLVRRAWRCTGCNGRRLETRLHLASLVERPREVAAQRCLKSPHRGA